MKDLNEYGNGRRSVILEMIKYCETEINKIKKHGIDKDTHIAATMTGQMKAFFKVKTKLVNKNLKNE